MTAALCRRPVSTDRANMSVDAVIVTIHLQRVFPLPIVSWPWLTSLHCNWCTGKCVCRCGRQFTCKNAHQHAHARFLPHSHLYATSTRDWIETPDWISLSSSIIFMKAHALPTSCKPTVQSAHNRSACFHESVRSPDIMQSTQFNLRTIACQAWHAVTLTRSLRCGTSPMQGPLTKRW